MSNKKLEFKCKNCGCTIIEEVMVDVSISSIVDNVIVEEDDYVDIEYGECENCGGVVDRFQCKHCGEVFKKDGENIVNKDDLVEYLQK